MTCIDKMKVLTALLSSLNARRGMDIEHDAGADRACELGFHFDVHLPRSRESTGNSSPFETNEQVRKYQGQWIWHESLPCQHKM